MGIKSKGRGTAAAFGLLLVFAGLVGGAVLYVLSAQRYDDVIEGFARAPVGCDTKLDFTETGEFYVFEEHDGLVDPPEGDCVPASQARQVFDFDLRGPSGEVVPRRDASIEYDIDGFSGESVARLEIDEPGEYQIEVTGDDDLIVAAVGRNPNDERDQFRTGAIVVAVAGVVLGLLMLVLAGRRSKKAAEISMPEGPGWGPSTPSAGPGAWPPEAPRLDQVPVNPHQPNEPATATPPLPERTPATRSAWAPPSAPEVVETDAPPPPAPAAPAPTPSLPNAPGRPSGVSPDAPDAPPHDPTP